MIFLQQTKLTKKEWNQIETPIQNEKEQLILKMVNDGYNNINIQQSNVLCLQEYLKIEMDYSNFIFKEFLFDLWKKINKNDFLKINSFIKTSNESLNKKDKIRITNCLNKMNDGLKSKIIEYIIMEHIKNLCKIMQKNDNYIEDKKYCFELYNINKLVSYYKEKINKFLLIIIDKLFENKINKLNYKLLLKNSAKNIEHNEVHNYKPFELYKHQKDIYSIFKNNKDKSKFVFYCAPTSSGKTLTPIGLCNDYKVIFMCASKHIGLSLAKSSYYLKKKIGFAFGCTDIEQIRLNYNAVNKYNTLKNGRKVPDHSDGSKVDLLICDLVSFESAMLYMKAFHELNNIVLFWDEPTIGLDEETNSLHEIIEKNWKMNSIPNIIFSCATLPKEEKISGIIDRFKNKYGNSYFKYIETSDQTSNLMIYDKYGNIILPHTEFESLQEMKDFIKYQDKKYYKFYNCSECCKFILFYDKVIDKKFIKTNFKNIENYNILYIKDLYVKCITEMEDEVWNIFKQKYFEKYPKNIELNTEIGPNVTTDNACSLTNGPTLFISNNIENICKYLLSKSKIDNKVINVIEEKIEYNRKISKILFEKQKDYEDKIEKYKDNEKMMTEMRLPPDILELDREIKGLQDKIKSLNIDSKYKPNTKAHYDIWNRNKEIEFENSDVFNSYLGDNEIKQILQLYTIDSVYKILLLLGIGIFSGKTIGTSSEYNQNDFIEENNTYVENIKQYAENKSLYLILANSDYIYGTNYQFSHCYLGKDMDNMSQEKIIQCIGRIGRQDKNKHFSFRFRGDKQIQTLYSISTNNIEADNMNRLFN